MSDYFLALNFQALFGFATAMLSIMLAALVKDAFVLGEVGNEIYWVIPTLLFCEKMTIVYNIIVKYERWIFNQGQIQVSPG